MAGASTSSGLIAGVDNAVLLATVTVVALMSLTIYFFFETVGRAASSNNNNNNNNLNNNIAPSPAATPLSGSVPAAAPAAAAGDSWFARAGVGVRALSVDRLFDLLATPAGIVLVSAFLLCATWLLFLADSLLWGVLFDRRASVLLFLLSAIVVALELYHFNPLVNRSARRLLERDD